MEYDKLLIKIVNKRNRKRLATNKYKNIKSYLENRFIDSKNWCENLYRLCYNINIKPRCSACGSKVKFINFVSGYRQYCSVECKCKENANKVAKTKLIKYGSATYNNINKTKLTKLDKYGNTKYNNYNKAKQTCLEKYGVDNASKSKEIRQKISNKENSEETKKKIYQTKKRNNSFRNTKPEQEIYKALLEKYPIVEREYKSEKYPFMCDFYIPEEDLYIEYNGYWTHGKHRFNKENKNDLTELAKWKEKAKTSRQYQNAIETWTKRDILKYETAKNNNLKYLTFYNMEEFYTWFKPL